MIVATVGSGRGARNDPLDGPAAATVLEVDAPGLALEGEAEFELSMTTREKQGAGLKPLMRKNVLPRFTSVRRSPAFADRLS